MREHDWQIAAYFIAITSLMRAVWYTIFDTFESAQAYNVVEDVPEWTAALWLALPGLVLLVSVRKRWGTATRISLLLLFSYYLIQTVAFALGNIASGATVAGVAAMAPALWAYMRS
ncbi:MAG: hypothetical protein RhofKO_25990 [Rhodothermales bacterium]